MGLSGKWGGKEVIGKKGQQQRIRALFLFQNLKWSLYLALYPPKTHMIPQDDSELLRYLASLGRSIDSIDFIVV